MRSRIARSLRVGHLTGVLAVSLSLGACSGDSWKEEVLLHDGQRIVVERSQTYKGRREIGQPAPIGEHTVRFKMPESGKQITWISEYGEDIGRTNFKPLAIHILHGIPYIVTTPNLSLSYAKWGSPNPPYVFFKFSGEEWQRIFLTEFPVEFKEINLAIATQADIKILTRGPLMTAAEIKDLNSTLTQEEFKTIHRTPLEQWKVKPGTELVRTADGWASADLVEERKKNAALLKPQAEVGKPAK